MREVVHIIQTPPFWIKTPPLSLTYLKSFLEKKGIVVRITDLNNILFHRTSSTPKRWLTLNRAFEQDLFNQAQKEHPGVFNSIYGHLKKASAIGFSLLGRNAPFTFSFAKEIKERFPKKHIIFGGPHTLFLEKEGKLNSCYWWVIGEGEIPFYTLISNTPISNSRKKIYRFEEIEDLDTLPFYDFYPLRPKEYSGVLPLLSSRGCPHQCTFCSERLLSRTFRHHSPRYIIEQIKFLQKRYRLNNFVFCDSLINYKRAWLHEFCRLLIDHKLHVKWEAQMRVEKGFPQELAELIKRSGCYNLFIGLESGSDRILQCMNKGFTRSDAINFFKTLRTQNLHFEVSLIFGHPDESENDFRETLQFITQHQRDIPKIAQVNPFVDYLGAFKRAPYPTQEAKMRVSKFLKIVSAKKIKHTKSFINNLVY
ncbi:MAG: B12-binding domain-containing radical SAM protein [Candidatus Omnitrophota bacterium]|nr:MAG: B12-binding domain-containing radical SAM protein [Candidatus Omnitrophota bacterium]